MMNLSICRLAVLLNGILPKKLDLLKDQQLLWADPPPKGLHLLRKDQQLKWHNPPPKLLNPPPKLPSPLLKGMDPLAVRLNLPRKHLQLKGMNPPPKLLNPQPNRLSLTVKRLHLLRKDLEVKMPVLTAENLEMVTSLTELLQPMRNAWTKLMKTIVWNLPGTSVSVKSVKKNALLSGQSS